MRIPNTARAIFKGVLIIGIFLVFFVLGALEGVRGQQVETGTPAILQQSTTGGPVPEPEPDPEPVGSPPVFEEVEDQFAIWGTPFELQLSATDPDNDPLVFKFLYNHPGLSITPDGLVTGYWPHVGLNNLIAVGIDDGQYDPVHGFVKVQVVDAENVFVVPGGTVMLGLSFGRDHSVSEDADYRIEGGIIFDAMTLGKMLPEGVNERMYASEFPITGSVSFLQISTTAGLPTLKLVSPIRMHLRLIIKRKQEQ